MYAKIGKKIHLNVNAKWMKLSLFTREIHLVILLNVKFHLTQA
jgi:hypothetical protein